MSETRAIDGRVTGQVQGVGFRDATRREAARLGLSGWVANEPDGSVALHAEGSDAAITQFERFLRDGPRGASVDGVEVREAEAEGDTGFDVRA